jgi:hypothetical protein
MTAFTITCVPTAATRFQSIDGAGTFSIDEGSNTYSNFFGSAFPSTSTIVDFAVTRSWNGAQTLVGQGGGYVLTARPTTTSQYTTTLIEGEFLIQVTSTGETFTNSATIVNGELVESFGPTTVVTYGQSVVSSTYIDTTTQGIGIDGYRNDIIHIPEFTGFSGTRLTATVVCLDTSEVGYVITQRPSFSAFLEDIAEEQLSSQFTVYPISSFSQGLVIGAGEEGNQQYVEETLELSRLIRTESTLTVADYNDSVWPLRTKSVAVFTPTTETHQVVNSYIDYNNWAAKSSTITTTTNTYLTEWGNLSWHGTYTRSIQVGTSIEYEATQYSRHIEFQVGLPIEAQPISNEFLINPTINFNANNYAASSIFSGCAHPSNASNPVLLAGPEGLTINRGAFSFGAITAVVPCGTWVYFKDGNTITASGDGEGVTIKDQVNNTTSANWTGAGNAISTVSQINRHQPVPNGVAANGEKTFVINAGAWQTINKSGRGTIEVESPSTYAGNSIVQNFAYMPALVFTHVNRSFNILGNSIGERKRYFTSSRNTTIQYISKFPLAIGNSLFP